MAGSPLAGVRTILETPILDEHKWAKVPSLPTDAVLLDLEDSVPPDRKAEARAKVLAYLDRPEYFAGRVPIPRVNHLDTAEGAEDLRVLGEHGVGLLAYPKLRSADELHEVRSLLGRSGNAAAVVVIVETARAVLELAEIARVPGVAGLILGPSDLATDVGWSLFAEDGLFTDAYHYPKAKLALTGAAYDLPVYDTVFVPELRDAGQVRAAARHARRMGFTGMATFYPPHLPVIDEEFSPTAEERLAAERTVVAYEEALARGAAAVQIDGRALIVQDYKRALRVLGKVDAR